MFHAEEWMPGPGQESGTDVKLIHILHAGRQVVGMKRGRSQQQEGENCERREAAQQGTGVGQRQARHG
ncbi:hypothetical protein GCM10023213_17190 [Prosthecobacter algae]|uniref:Uncharacterized protein n=1 Tax=Prosthecobacter algae TaxID=1144682 RepID=A0ABP9P1P1_9BACT